MTTKMFSNAKAVIDAVLVLQPELQMGTGGQTDITVIDWELLSAAEQIAVINKFATFGFTPVD